MENQDQPTDFLNELQSLLNRYSRENISNTPDFILADYMRACLMAFDHATMQRDEWYGGRRSPALTSA
jgi:hypothetical protein